MFEVRAPISHLYSQPEALKPVLVTEMKASVSGLVPALSIFPFLSKQQRGSLIIYRNLVNVVIIRGEFPRLAMSLGST
jgi:hypothetical protein